MRLSEDCWDQTAPGLAVRLVCGIRAAKTWHEITVHNRACDLVYQSISKSFNGYILFIGELVSTLRCLVFLEVSLLEALPIKLVYFEKSCDLCSVKKI